MALSENEFDSPVLGRVGLFFSNLGPLPQTNQYLDIAPSIQIMLQKWL